MMQRIRYLLPCLLQLLLYITPQCKAQASNYDDIIGGLIFQSDGDYGTTTPSILRSLKVDIQIIDGIGQVSMTQEFETPSFFPNPTSGTTAAYQLPLDELAAVTSFRAQIDDRVITAIVKERKEARKEFEDAVSAGKTAYLAEKSRADIFLISLGNLPRGKIVRVTLVYVTTLEAIGGDTLRVVFPTAVAPRYEPFVNSEGGIPDGMELINSGVTIGMTVDMAVELVSVESPTHNVRVTDLEGDDGKKSVEVLVVDEDPQKRDLVVYVKSQMSSDPQIYVESSTTYDSTAFMLSIVPDIPQDLFDGISFKSEFIFIIDRSGSMSGDKIDQVRQAMPSILEKIPQDSLFNIVGFGDTYESLFEESRSIANTEAKNAAIQHISGLQADLGGTEILKPLQYVLNKNTLTSFQRIIFVITDGEVSNTDDVIEYVGQRHSSSSSVRVFSLGIGEHVSALLVRGIARAGGGTAAFVDGNDSEAIERAVERQMDVAVLPAFDNVEIEWGRDGKQAPYKTPPLISGGRFLIYFLMELVDELPESIHFRSHISKTDKYINYTVSKDAFVEAPKKQQQQNGNDESTFDENLLIHKMAVRSLIRDLEEGSSILHAREATEDEIRNEIVRLGITYQIASSETSFVAVDNFDWNESLLDSEVFMEDAAGPPGKRSFSGSLLLSPAWFWVIFIFCIFWW